MKKQALFIAIILTLFAVNGQSKRKADKDTQEWKYEIEVVGIGTQGTSLVKAWTYSKKIATATEQAKKNAVHGILFKGYAGKAGIPGMKALVNDPNAEVQYEEFFKTFFEDGGKYMKYVYVSGDAIAAQDVYEVGKLYKVGVVVSVNIRELRADLEQAGIIRSLNSGF